MSYTWPVDAAVAFVKLSSCCCYATSKAKVALVVLWESRMNRRDWCSAIDQRQARNFLGALLFVLYSL